jgi:hypothetical protein
MRTYFYCIEDSYRQRTGHYRSIQLNESDIELDRFGFKTYNGYFLFEDEYQVQLACQD